MSKKANQINSVLDRKIRELNSLRDWVAQLEGIIKEAKEVIEQQNSTMIQLETEIRKLETLLKDKQEENDKLSNELQYFKHSYLLMDEIYKKYLSLNVKIRQDLKGIFGNAESISQFFSAAVQETHLDKFWDYLNHEINNHNLDIKEEIDLKEIFDFCFANVNLSNREPIYKRLHVNIGDKFDSKLMIKTSDSNQLGDVGCVKLEGYKYIVSGNVVKPSLVFLEK